MESSRRLWSVEGNSQLLDGGAMFGNAPKVLWERWVPPDEQNRIALSCRAMLIRDGERILLFETGIGVFLEPKLRERFGVREERHVLLENLRALGVAHEDVDAVVLSHLHFDHAGGLLSPWAPDREPSLLFPKARFVVGRAAFERSVKPHARDRASFIPALAGLLEGSGRLELVEGASSEALGAGYRFHYSHGHTPGLMLTEVAGQDGPLLFAGDLIPGTPWVHLPITMGYDRFPEQLIEEKAQILAGLVSRNGRLFYTHDTATAISGVACDERGRYRAVGGQPSCSDQPL